jgi:hypothetical protein
MKPMKPMEPMKPMDFGPPWWPNDLGQPSSSGGQNGIRYAFFPQARRLAIDTDGKIAVYDSADHRINGVSQQQGGTSSLVFSSQQGDVKLDALKKIS